MKCPDCGNEMTLINDGETYECLACGHREDAQTEGTAEGQSEIEAI